MRTARSSVRRSRTARHSVRRSRTTLLAVLPLVLAASALTACASTIPSGTASPTSTLQTGADGPKTDYQDTNNWLKLSTTNDKPVDVFYLYPTAYEKADASAPDIAPVTDPGMRKGAQSAYERQATAFEGLANIYAPYYRQADATFALSLPQAEHVQVITGAPLIDVTAAFTYYLDHYNPNRPFILVAHSQGSDVATHLLATYLSGHPMVLARMVAAYIPGYSVTPDYLAANPRLKFGKSAHDTGVLLSWNTEAPTIGGPNPVLLPGALVINPITWTQSEKVAKASQSLGSWLPDKSGTYAKVPHYADAQVDTAKGVLVTTTPSVSTWSPGGPNAFPKGVFHTFDIPFYYFDIQANAKQRIAAYFAGH
jgi:pimeloyl-ACP methyl ester carboxylesterase